MSNFIDAANINALVGNEYNGGWGAIDHQIGIVRSEFNELVDGIEARDIHELRDGIADVLFTVYGLAHRAGVDADADHGVVVASQFTKFDRTEEDANLTRKKYEDQGIEVYQEVRGFDDNGAIVGMIVTYSAKEQLDHRGQTIPRGKWLKSHRFQEPVFVALPEDVQLKLDL